MSEKEKVPLSYVTEERLVEVVPEVDNRHRIAGLWNLDLKTDVLNELNEKNQHTYIVCKLVFKIASWIAVVIGLLISV